MNKPIVLIVLDGWGYREDPEANAIAAADTPHWDRLWENNTHTLISGSGEDVGLPDQQMGNSEVGHMNLGAGRVVFQDFVRINQAVSDGEFFDNPALVNAVKKASAKSKAVHILGLLSPGGVHSHEKHIHAAAELAVKHGANKVYFHAFLDGRDTPPRSALSSIQALEAKFQSLGCGEIASLTGRFYAMDRDKRWDRIEAAYKLLTEGKGSFHADTPEEALHLAYERGESDEFVKPTVIHKPDQSPSHINDGDAVIFMNFRSDRARELSHALTDKEFDGFERKRKPQLSDFVTLTQYSTNIESSIAFAPQRLKNVFADYISQLGLKQLRIAETEKYAHVTFFFNGGVETPYEGEDRILVASPKVTTYDLAPEMSAPELADRLISAIQTNEYDFVICNFANADMLGHTGDFNATVKAIEIIDECLGKVVNAIQELNGETIITADHGNAELMFNEKSQQPHTAHTNLPVPLLYVGRPVTLTDMKGTLSDVAPTMLHIMGLEQPKEMTGKSLLTLK